MIDRRGFLKGAAAAAAATSLAGPGRQAATAAEAAAVAGAAAKRPNLLFVLCDQMCIDAISAYRDAFEDKAYLAHRVETPNIDRLVREGVSFLHSYTPNPVCSPARGSLFTGRHSSETGLIVNNVGIDRDVPNMGQWFEENSDYRRVYCGKWHAGGPWNNPSVDGPRKIPGFDTIPNGPDIFGIQMDHGISTSMEAFLRGYSDDQPFLAVASFMDPHDICFWTPAMPGRVPSRDLFRLADALPPLPPNQDYDFDELFPGTRIPEARYGEMEWRNYLHDYCRMVECLDANVGRLLDALDDRDDETLLVFFSDHGDGAGRHRRVQKWDGFQSDSRVPFIIHGPGLGVRQGVIDDEHVVNGLDIMATFCDYAGIPAPPHCRGRSIRPLAEGAPVEWDANTCFELRASARVVVNRRYKYMMAYEQSPADRRPTPESVFLTADGTPTEFLPGEGRSLRRMPTKVLFDLESDPWETVNLARSPRHADVVAEMEAWLHDTLEPALVPGHAYTRA